MNEEQKKQLEIIRGCIKNNNKATKELECAMNDLHQAVKSLVDGLDVYTVIAGHSDAVLAASALIAIYEQMKQLC